MDIKVLPPVGYNSVTKYVCEATGSSSLTWKDGTDCTVSFLRTNPRNSFIHCGGKKFELTGFECSSDVSQICNFSSTAYINVTRAVNGTLLECTDGVNSTEIQILLNNSEYSIVNTFPLSQFHSKE